MISRKYEIARWPPTYGRCGTPTTRAFEDEVTEYFGSAVGASIADHFRANTRLVFMESPGSLTFEIQDVPAIVAACRPRKIATLLDNTWATPVFFKPLRLGVDVSIHSATKFITGHSDSFLGAIVSNAYADPFVRAAALRLGQVAGPDEA